MNKLLNKYNAMNVAAKAGIWFVICSCLQSGIKFIALPIFANIMSVSDYGTVTLYTSWMSVIFIFATIALGRANGVFYVAMVKYPKDRDRFTTAMEGLTVFLCALTFMVIYFSVAIFGDWMKIGIAQYSAMCVELIGYGIMLLWSLRARYEYEYKPLLLMTAVYSIGTIIVPMICVLLCPEKWSKADVKNWAGAITSLLIGLYAFYLTYKKSNKIVDIKYWKYAFKFNIVLIPHYLSNVILIQSDRIMIAELISETAAAIYNVAYTLGVAAQVITQAFINAINPWMYKKMSEGKSNEVGKVVVPLILFVSILVLCICLVMPEIFGILFPSTYYEAISVIPPVAIGVVWAFIFNLYASIELYFSGNKYVSLASFTGAAINVVLNLILIPKFGYFAAAYTTLACDIIYAFMHTLFSKKMLKKNMPEVKKLVPVKESWMIGIATTIIGLIILMLYPYSVARYAIFSVVLVLSIIYRKRIIKILKFKSK